MSKNVLGRGLSALIPQIGGQATEEKSEGITELDVAIIGRSDFQPRVDFNDEAQQELVASVKEKGIIQPVIVRPLQNGYELIAGERRLRAARLLGMEKIPAIIKEMTDGEVLEVSLIENIQREDLNPLEEAKGYKRLVDDFHQTQEQVAEKVGKDRTTVANSLRLLNLPVDIQFKLASGKISTGHAKVILSLDNAVDQRKIAEKIIAEKLSVRETEKCIAELREVPVHKRKKMPYKDPHIIAIEEDIQRKLGTQVKICQGKKKGRIEIEYYTKEDLERILEFFGIQEEESAVSQ